jgi:hypothetical protein
MCGQLLCHNSWHRHFYEHGHFVTRSIAPTDRSQNGYVLPTVSLYLGYWWMLDAEELCYSTNGISNDPAL